MAIHDEDQTLPPSSAMATASLVIGLASLVACGLGIVSGPVAIVLGIVSGRRTGFTSKQIGGIASGALAFVTTAAAMIGLFVYAARDDGAAVTNQSLASALIST